MDHYNSFEEIKFDLKRLHLERQIALEHMKGLKHEVDEDLAPYQWMQTVLNIVKKLGALYFIKKIIR